MKKNLKVFLSLILCLCLTMNIVLPAIAANENNILGVTFSAVLDTPTIEVSDQDQTVVMTVNTSEGVLLEGIGADVVWDEALTLTAIENSDSRIDFSSSINLDNGRIRWDGTANLDQLENVENIAVVTFTVPANTPAGTYNVGMNAIELCKNYGDIWEDGATVSTTLTIVEAGAANGYTAGLTSLSKEIRVDDLTKVNIGISHSTDSVFAAGEVTVSYDNTKLAFSQADSVLGTATVKDNAGTLILEDYGADKNFGTGVYELAFRAIATGEANVSLVSAAFVNKDNAVKSDLIDASLSTDELNITIDKKAYNVTLPEIFEGQSIAIDGEDYTFTIEDNNYDYTVSATVNGSSIEVIDNGDGSYTIQNVTGEIQITGSRTEKTYDVTFSGNGGTDVTDASATATYNTAYSFTMPTAQGWAYELESIQIGGTSYTGYSVENSVYTIPGTAITGEIVVTITKSATEANVTVEGNGAGAAEGFDVTADIGTDYTLTIIPETGFVYKVTATMNGTAVTVIDNGDNTYTIKSVSGPIVYTVEKNVILDGVTVTEYLTLDGTVMWLVKNDTELAEGKVPTYADDKMFWSDEYQTYCYLVIAETLSVEEAKEQVNVIDGTAKTVDYGMDVNKTGKVDASDAQSIYNMYNAAYSQWSADATMEKFLYADVNADETVNVEDAAAVISKILE